MSRAQAMTRETVRGARAPASPSRVGGDGGDQAGVPVHAHTSRRRIAVQAARLSVRQSWASTRLVDDGQGFGLVDQHPALWGDEVAPPGVRRVAGPATRAAARRRP